MIVTIRKAEEKDYKELMKLYGLFVEEDRYSKHDNDSFHAVLKEPTCDLYVAEAEDSIIGFALFSTRFVVRYPKKIMQLEELFVLEEMRKHGIGRRFVEVMEENARDLDCFSIYIESSKKRGVAHKFYESMGYEKNGSYFKKIL